MGAKPSKEPKGTPPRTFNQALTTLIQSLSSQNLKDFFDSHEFAPQKTNDGRFRSILGLINYLGMEAFVETLDNTTIDSLLADLGQTENSTKKNDLIANFLSIFDDYIHSPIIDFLRKFTFENLQEAVFSFGFGFTEDTTHEELLTSLEYALLFEGCYIAMDVMEGEWCIDCLTELGMKPAVYERENIYIMLKSFFPDHYKHFKDVQKAYLESGEETRQEKKKTSVKSKVVKDSDDSHIITLEKGISRLEIDSKFTEEQLDVYCASKRLKRGNKGFMVHNIFVFLEDDSNLKRKSTTPLNGNVKKVKTDDVIYLTPKNKKRVSLPPK